MLADQAQRLRQGIPVPPVDEVQVVREEAAKADAVAPEQNATEKAPEAMS